MFLGGKGDGIAELIFSRMSKMKKVRKVDGFLHDDDDHIIAAAAAVEGP